MKHEKTAKAMNSQGPLGFVLFMAYLGAAVYFVQQSSGFWGFIWALLKAVAWPGVLIFQAFESLGV